jgi:hypothetical protein
MTVQNATVTPALTKLTFPPYGYNISLNVDGDFSWGEEVLVYVSGCDSGSQQNCNDFNWTFTIEPDLLPPEFIHLNPGDGFNVPQNFIITMAILDYASGVDKESIKLFIAPSGSAMFRRVKDYLNILPIEDGYFIEYDYPGLFPSGLLTVLVEASDKALPTPNVYTYQYTVNVLLGVSPDPY